MTFDLHQLQAFATVVASGTLGRAAIALHVTQPALSRTIRSLEEHLGAPLFERHSKGMLLTDVGHALLPHAQSLLRESAMAQEEISAMLGLAKGTVRIGTISSISSSLLPVVLDNFSQKFPKLQIQVIEDVWDRVADALVNNSVDLAFGVYKPEMEGLSAIQDCCWDDMSFLVAGAHHPLQDKPDIQLIDTVHERWVTAPRGTPPFQSLKSIFSRHELALPNIVVETRSSTLIKSLVKQSGFLSWMPEAMFSAERQAGWIKTLNIPHTTDPFTLTAYRRSSGSLPKPALQLLEELRVVCRHRAAKR
ncbi:MAG: LysR family transcriptional regulator [Burkholderiaceae bacterium]|nr:LysR family transcriptional regulator [Burkholderiaceae bacterium]